MKKAIYIMTILLAFLSFVGCGASPAEREADGNQGKTAEVRSDGAETVDVDLTKLGSTMVYSEVYNMMNTPEDYMGKRVRMKGSFAYAQGDNKYYFACLISDATACCSQGIEFVLKDERTFPEDYPERGTEITVTGVFDTYKEGEHQYCQLVDAVMDA